MAAALLLLSGCAGPAWNAGALARAHPGLSNEGARRLEDLHPYVLPEAGVVTLLTCRWPTRAPISVSLPSDATAVERRALEAALHAWENAGLGVRFRESRGGSAAIRIVFEKGPIATAEGPGSGDTRADCRIEAGPPEMGATRVGAALVAARIRMARHTPPDARGRARSLSPAELTGTALHELGHALGFQGHVRSGSSVMTVDAEALRRLGARVLAGRPFAAPALAALYALPSGTVLAQARVAPWRTDWFDRMARLARTKQLEGPLLRVGDETARMFWRDGSGDEWGLDVVNLADTLQNPARALVVPERRSYRALRSSADSRS